MKILLIEKSADGLLDLAVRAGSLKHDVRYWLRDYDQHKCPVGRGMVERVADWRASMRWADLVIVGSNDYCVDEFERWKREGVPVLTGNAESASWEYDRAKGMQVFRRARIEVPDYRPFTDYDSAIAYVKKQDRPFVSKPSGHCDDKSLSYVAKTPADLVYMLERWKRNGKRQGLEFILQEKVEGIEFACGAWFGPDGFAEGWEENFEFKKLMAGDLGVNTGELGTVMRYTRKSKLAQKVLAPLEHTLHRIGYVGNIDVNCIIDGQGTPWPLEFTTRLGYPAIDIEMVLFDSDPFEFLHGVVIGRPPKGAHRFDADVAIGLVWALPDWPYSHVTRKEVVGVPIYGLDGRLRRHFHPCQVMTGESPQQTEVGVVTQPCLVSAGDYVAVITGTAETVQQARGSAYRHIKALSMPNSPFYRNDIGSRLMKQLPELQRYGYATGLRYA